VDGLARIAKTVREEHGAIDFLILSAGAVTPKLFSDYGDPVSLRKDLDANLWGTILPVHRFLPLLPSGARILMISSGFGLMGAAGYSMYCAGKAGVVNFAGALRRELLHRRVAVYVACPGDIDTPMLHAEIEMAPAWMRKSSPRRLASAQAVAARILKRARGRRKFLIVPSFEVGILMLIARLPRLWLDAILDRIFPTPEVKT
jgi:NAD(P)-dependent dehydrogenase (short-subunit alcohol dehydrogenase family)